MDKGKRGDFDGGAESFAFCVIQRGRRGERK